MSTVCVGVTPVVEVKTGIKHLTRSGQRASDTNRDPNLESVQVRQGTPKFAAKNDPKAARRILARISKMKPNGKKPSAAWLE